MLIKIKNLKLKTIMGVYEWEKNFEREIVINAEINTNHHKSLESDNINDTIDYAKIINGIIAVIKQDHYKLIEKMAQEVMNFIMKDDKITRCKLEIDKVTPFDNVESCSITIEEIRS